MPAPDLSQMFVLYVDDQARARAFWTAALDTGPVLDVPGMTALPLPRGGTLGLMPRASIQRLLGDGLGTLPRPAPAQAELYLHVPDPEAALARALAAGAKPLDAVRPRDWGDRAGYCQCPDGHVLAVAAPLGERLGPES